MAMEKFWIFIRKNSRNILKLMRLIVTLNILSVMFVHFTIYNTKQSNKKLRNVSSKIMSFYHYGVAKCK